MLIRVSIVEDNAVLRESLSVLINGSDGFRCISTFANAETAIQELPRNWPDIVLMDINLPKMSGIECVAKLKAMKPALQVLMLTVYVDSEKIFKSLMAGASGYLIKQTPPAKILEALSDVQRGGAPMSNNIARKVVEYFQQLQQTQQSNVETENLTKREYEILNHLAKGYQDKEIAEMLSVSVITVRTHIRSIYQKLHVRSRTEAAFKFLSSQKEPG